MAPDPASRARTAALRTRAGSPSRPPSRSGASRAGERPDAAGPDRPAPTGPPGPAEQPDPAFWGEEPRPLRRPRRSRAEARGAPRWWVDLLERARDTRIEVGVGVVAVVVAALVGGVVWYRMGADGGAAPAAVPARAAASRPTAVPSTAGPAPAGATRVTVTTAAAAGAHRGATVVVHVAGAVARPGVLLMPEGARVIDAVEGAGGATADADLDRLNLAARLVDGQRILVARVGVPSIADPGTAADPAADPGALIDLNSATSAQLEGLPGIGPALAGAIIAERDRRGGFRSVNELREVRGIGEARFADLRDRVSV